MSLCTADNIQAYFQDINLNVQGSMFIKMGFICQKTIVTCIVIQKTSLQVSWSAVALERTVVRIALGTCVVVCLGVLTKLALFGHIHGVSCFCHNVEIELVYLPSFWTVHSCWQRGQRLFCLIHRLIQQWWKEWLHSPQTTTQSLLPIDPLVSTLDSPWQRRQASITWKVKARQKCLAKHSSNRINNCRIELFMYSSFLLTHSPSTWKL